MRLDRFIPIFPRGEDDKKLTTSKIAIGEIPFLKLLRIIGEAIVLQRNRFFPSIEHLHPIGRIPIFVLDDAFVR